MTRSVFQNMDDSFLMWKMEVCFFKKYDVLWSRKMFFVPSTRIFVGSYLLMLHILLPVPWSHSTVISHDTSLMISLLNNRTHSFRNVASNFCTKHEAIWSGIFYWISIFYRMVAGRGSPFTSVWRSFPGLLLIFLLHHLHTQIYLW